MNIIDAYIRKATEKREECLDYMNQLSESCLSGKKDKVYNEINRHYHCKTYTELEKKILDEIKKFDEALEYIKALKNGRIK